MCAHNRFVDAYQIILSREKMVIWNDFIIFAEESKRENQEAIKKEKVAKSRDEATRTPDPYVPNVVRYQLRYIPILRVQRYAIFLNYVQEKG